jgi:hypothetical protein
MYESNKMAKIVGEVMLMLDRSVDSIKVEPAKTRGSKMTKLLQNFKCDTRIPLPRLIYKLSLREQIVYA